MLVLSSVLLAPQALAEPSQTNIFSPESTPDKSILDLSTFVLAITGITFVVVVTLLAYSILKFQATSVTKDREPAQVYGSRLIELAWTIILIVVVLFLATARSMGAPDPSHLSQQDALQKAGADAVYYATRLRGASNELAKRKLGSHHESSNACRSIKPLRDRRRL